MRTLITGATGLIGKLLTSNLERLGHELIILSRKPDSIPQQLGVETLYWDALGEAPKFPTGFKPIDLAILLAGEPITDGLWTRPFKQRLIDSRVRATEHLLQALVPHKGDRFRVLSASAVGIFGDRGDEILTESSPPGRGFLAELCQSWERAAKTGLPPEKVTILRFGLVIAAHGGALQKMLPLFRMGLGGRLGNGKQWMSWIHVADAVSAILYSVEKELFGPLHVTSPEPVINSDFTRILAKALHRPALAPVPSWALRVLLPGLGKELLASQKVLPDRLHNAGFVYQFNNLSNAIASVLA